MVIALEQDAHLVHARFAERTKRAARRIRQRMQEQPVELARRKRATQKLELGKRATPLLVQLALEAPAAHFQDNALGDDVARKPPGIVTVMQLVEWVTEDAVHHHVKVIAHHLVEAGVEPAQNREGLEVHLPAIGGERIAALHGRRFGTHAPQSQVKEPELQHELDPAFIQHVFGELCRPFKPNLFLIDGVRHTLLRYEWRLFFHCPILRELFSI